MTTKNKEHIRARLKGAYEELREAWAMTDDFTTEDRILRSTLISVEALFHILNHVKVED